MRTRPRLWPLWSLFGASAVVAAAWAISYPPARYLPSLPTNGGWRVRSTNGRLEVYRYQTPLIGMVSLDNRGMVSLDNRPGPLQPRAWAGTSIEHPLLFGQIVYERGATWTANSTHPHVAVHVRYLLLAALLGVALTVATVWWWLGRARAIAIARGLCPTCGYDLCATPDRCPECGAVAEAAKGAAT